MGIAWALTYSEPRSTVYESYFGERDDSGPVRCRNGLFVLSGSGVVFCNIIRQREPDEEPVAARSDWQPPRAYRGHFNGKTDMVGACVFAIGGLAVSHSPDAGFGQKVTSILIPYWLPFLFCAICPIWQSVNLARRRNGQLAGHCRKCGYDLRASKDRCPECGTPIP
jgi:hypothetical protein